MTLACEGSATPTLATRGGSFGRSSLPRKCRHRGRCRGFSWPLAGPGTHGFLRMTGNLIRDARNPGLYSDDTRRSSQPMVQLGPRAATSAETEIPQAPPTAPDQALPAVEENPRP